MKNTSLKNKARNISRKAMLGILCAGSLGLGSGCASVKYGSSKSGYGLVKIVDGTARVVTGASLGEKAGVYSSNPQDANYKAPEVYTGKENDISDRIGYTIMTPVRVIRQVGEGVSNVAEGIYIAGPGQLVPNNKAGIVVNELISPENREGIPMVSKGLDYAEEKVGHVNTDSPRKKQLEERLDTTEEKITGALPLVHPLGDYSLPWYRRIARSIGNGVYYVLFSLAGGKASGGNGGIGGGNGAGGISGGNGAGGAGGL